MRAVAFDEHEPRGEAVTDYSLAALDEIMDEQIVTVHVDREATTDQPIFR